MTRNINDASLANLKHYEGKWKHGQTRTIRVPIALAEATLEYALQLDNGMSPDTNDSKSKNELPEAATLLNCLKAKRKKSTASLADIEALLEMIEG